MNGWCPRLKVIIFRRGNIWASKNLYRQMGQKLGPLSHSRKSFPAHNALNFIFGGIQKNLTLFFSSDSPKKSRPIFFSSFWHHPPLLKAILYLRAFPSQIVASHQSICRERNKREKEVKLGSTVTLLTAVSLKRICLWTTTHITVKNMK